MNVIYVSALIIQIRITLKISITMRRQLFCIKKRLLVNVFDFLTSLNICLTIDSYIMIKRITTL